MSDEKPGALLTLMNSGWGDGAAKSHRCLSIGSLHRKETGGRISVAAPVNKPPNCHKRNPSHQIGIDQTEGFLTLARKQVPSAEFRTGDTQNIDLPDDVSDYAVSDLVLNFVPDKAKALSEMPRIVRPEGSVGLYVWDYAGQMQIMRYFFDTARLIDPSRPLMMTASTHQSAGQTLFPRLYRRRSVRCRDNRHRHSGCLCRFSGLLEAVPGRNWFRSKILHIA